MREKRSSHWPISVMGRRAGGGGRPAAWGISSWTVTSAISTNSKSRSRFTTFADSDAAGLKGPGLPRSGLSVGTVTLPLGAVAVAAAASRCSPLVAAVLGRNVGSDRSVAAEGCVPKPAGAVPEKRAVSCEVGSKRAGPTLLGSGALEGHGGPGDCDPRVRPWRGPRPARSG